MFEAELKHWGKSLASQGKGSSITPRVVYVATCCFCPLVSLGLEPDWEGQEILCILQIHDIYNSIAGSSQKKLLMDLLQFIFFHSRKRSKEVTWTYRYIQQLELLLFLFLSMDLHSVFSHPSLSSGKSISFLQIWPISPRSFGGGSVANSTDVCGMTPQPELLQVRSCIYVGVCGYLWVTAWMFWPTMQRDIFHWSQSCSASESFYGFSCSWRLLVEAQKMKRARPWQQMVASSLQCTQEFSKAKLDGDAADVYGYFAF